MSRPQSPLPSACRSLLAVSLAACLHQAALADIQLEVVANPDPALPGETLDVELTVTNDGGSDRSDVLVVFDYPVGLVALGNGFFDGTCPSSACEPGEQALFTIPVLGAGEGITFSVPPSVSSAAVPGTMIVFDVQVFDDALLEAQDSATVFVDGGRELELALVEDHDPVVPGEELGYTLTFGVLATSTGSPDATLSFPLPAGTSLVSASDGGQLSGGIVEWSLGSLDPGASGERHVRLQVDGGLPLGSIMVGEAFFQDLAAPPNTAVSRTAARVQDAQPLTVTVVAGPDGARPGEMLDVELTVSNTGTSERAGIVLSLEFPGQLQALANGFFDGQCPSSACEVKERALFDIGTLAAGDAVTFSMPPRAAGYADGTVVRLEAEVTDSTGEVSEGGTSFVIEAARELDLVLVDDHDPVVPGELLSYALTYGVREASAGASGTVLRLPLPAGTSFVSASGGGALVGEAVEWSLGRLDPGASGEQRVTVMVAPSVGLGSVLTTEATLESASSSAREVRHQSVTRVQDEQPLTLVVAASPDPARAGELLDVELTVGNPGSSDRAGVVLTLEYPDGLDALANGYVDGSCPSSACESAERLTFDIGTLLAGAATTFSIPARVAPGVPDGAVVRLEAEVTDATGEVRESGASVAVESARKLQLAVAKDRDPVAPGELLSYTLTYGILDTSIGAPGATLRLPLPAGTSFVSASDAGALVGNVIEWPLGGLNPGGSGERRATLRVAPSVELGSLITTEAKLVGGTFPEREVRYETATRVELPTALEVSMAVGPNPARQGELLNVEVTVGNAGSVDRSGVVLTLEYPEQLQALSNGVFDGSCPSSACEPRERATFVVGTLPAGEAVTFSLPPRPAFVPAGTVIRFEAWATDATGEKRVTGTSLAVNGARDLDLVVMDKHDSLRPGELVRYVMTYGALETGVGSVGSVLRFELPAGTRLATASNNGVLVGDAVEWYVGTLAPGAGGERYVILQVEPQLAAGSVLTARTTLIGGVFGDLKAKATTRVEANPALKLRVVTPPQLSIPGSTLDLRLRVTNTTPFDRNGLVMVLEIPDWLFALSNTLFGGDCPSIACEAQERAAFDIGILAGGQTVGFPVPPQISTGALRGSVIRFDAFVSDAAGAVGAAGAAFMVGEDFDPAEDSGAWSPLLKTP